MAEQKILSDLAKFHKSYTVMDNGCWQWRRAISRAGYGVMRVTCDSRPRAVNAHRWGYQQLVGPISPELTLDHLCRNRGCVNPAHLEPVTQGQNVRRGRAMDFKEYCKRGHLMSGDNLSILSSGKRRCLACKRFNNKQAWEKNHDTKLAYSRNYYHEKISPVSRRLKSDTGIN